jgi:DNA-binding PadR family transcriptional regulator
MDGRMHSKFDHRGRFTDPSLLILTSLAGGAKHGYALMTDIAEFSGVSMEPGTLYGALARLERQGWVEALPAESRRRPYRLTAAGLEVLQEQLTTMNRVVTTVRQRIALAPS